MLSMIVLQAMAGVSLSKIGAAIGAAAIVLAAAYGIGKIGSSAMDATARQPEASDKIRTSMIVVAALIEGVALFAIVICFMILFV